MEMDQVVNDDVMRPNYEVTVGSKKFSRETGPELVSLRVFRNVGLPTDSAELFLIGSNSYSFKKGDDTKIKLGYDDKTEPVFRGAVENINQELNTVRITALGSGAKLLRLRLNRIYLSQTVGQIVKNIAQEAKIQVKTASDGITVPIYTITDKMNGYEHILRLAERCNFDAYFTEDEQLVFKEWGKSKNHPIKYGHEIIRLEAFDYSPLYKSTEVYGESPSSIKGSDTYHWLTKKEVKGEAGSGEVLSVHDPAIRDQKTAETVAKARMEKLKYTLGLVVDTVGKPAIKLGDTVTFENAPYSGLKGTLEVRSLEHNLSKDRGFMSIVTCWSKV